MLMAVHDRITFEKVQKDRAKEGLDKYDEVWDGVVVVMPLPNDEHQEIVGGLDYCITAALGWPNPHRIRPGVNLSDRAKGWDRNYREPDFVVFLEGNPAVNHNTHWVGGPDFLVEIVSPDDQSREKLPFYAKLDTKEVLIIDRDPWRLELYQLRRGKLRLVGKAEPSNGKPLSSNVLPLTFALIRGKPRPKIRITHTESKQEWTF